MCTAKEVELSGQLDKSSAFIFENYMQHLKQMVRSARNPLVQVARRLKEDAAFGSLHTPMKSVGVALHSFCCRSPSNYCVLEDGRCRQVVSIDSTHATCIVFANAEPVYMKPCDSHLLGIFKVRLKSGKMKILPLDAAAHKAMCHTNYIDGCLIFISLLHHI